MSNTNVSVNELPRTQLLQDNDLIIVQTENGTQTITFENLNIVKTDLYKNASVQSDLDVVGDLRASTLFVNHLCANDVSSESFARILDLRKTFTVSANVSSVAVIYSNFYNLYKIDRGSITPTLFTVAIEQPLLLTPFISRSGIQYLPNGDLSVTIILSGYPTTAESSGEIRFLYIY
jgi:hypothetical protein